MGDVMSHSFARTAAALTLCAGLSGCAGMLDLDGVSYHAPAPAPQTDNLPPEAKTLGDGLVAYWKLDGEGTDSTLNGSDLIPELDRGGASPTFRNGKVGSALYPLSPGTTPTTQCANCVAMVCQRASPAVDVSRDFTISVWVMSEPTMGTQPWGHYGIFEFHGVFLWASGPNPRNPTLNPWLRLQDGDTQLGEAVDTTTDFRTTEAGMWTHIVASRDRTTLTLRTNGKETARVALPPGVTPTSSNSTLHVGWESAGYQWQGAVDDFAIWNRALTAAEADALYALGKNGMEIPR